MGQRIRQECAPKEVSHIVIPAHDCSFAVAVPLEQRVAQTLVRVQTFERLVIWRMTLLLTCEWIRCNAAIELRAGELLFTFPDERQILDFVVECPRHHGDIHFREKLESAVIVDLATNAREYLFERLAQAMAPCFDLNRKLVERAVIPGVLDGVTPVDTY